MPKTIAVPREPTQAMIDAALKRCSWIKSVEQRKAHAETYCDMWRLMWDAAFADQGKRN